MISVCHGGESLAHMGGPGSRVSYGSGWANACNAPFRMYKHYLHEGGISTPLIVHWPSGLPMARDGERIVIQPTHLIDLMATVVDLAGAAYPAEFHGHRIEPMEGLSLRPFFMGTPAPGAWDRRELCWEHEGNAAIRLGDHKLVRLGAKGG
jgi:arylsulfatase A-like enzyme